MHHQKSEQYFLLALLVGVLLLFLSMLRPFLYALILAIIFAVVFEPLHKKIVSYAPGKKGVAAFLSTLCVLVIVVLPLIAIGVQIFKEASDLSSSLESGGGAQTLASLVDTVRGWLSQYISLPADTTLDLGQYAKAGASWVVLHFGSFVSGAARVFIGIFIFLVALYYLFKDGDALRRRVADASPLQNVHDYAIGAKLTSAINAVVKGKLIIALLQGVLTGVGFALFGVSSPVLWGTVAAIAALIPAVGAGLVIAPAVVALFAFGETAPAVALAVWGVVGVGLADNLLGPKLLEKDVELHPFLLLLSAFGGLSYFGPIGFLFGPLVLVLLFALVDVYFAIRKEQKLP
ncbi:MAG: AI-2E family transporter [Patescibacteria group bacterium]